MFIVCHELSAVLERPFEVRYHRAYEGSRSTSSQEEHFTVGIYKGSTLDDALKTAIDGLSKSIQARAEQELAAGQSRHARLLSSLDRIVVKPVMET
jgi:hypothetical protein